MAIKFWGSGSVFGIPPRGEYQKNYGAEASKILVTVLTLGNNVWRKIQNSPAEHEYSMNIVNTRGTVNWLAIPKSNAKYDCKKITIEQFAIISPYLGMETHTQLRPPQGFYDVPFVEPDLSVLTDCLCFSHDFKKTCFIIWQMKEFGVEESW
ncbi:uncharacterized protein LOC131631434 [Vicia villosa]|uniref:uncharacterized protein LOC131631434 n=1 Tax=Vicia villosa TaxID=3911 RepID=UPI00273B7C1C|nr:uncharacterized protein LOC131631434 [Vicia villosa]